MTKIKPKTTPWREIRSKRIKPEDEPRIAKIREQMVRSMQAVQTPGPSTAIRDR
jgi:hypothetical protein